MQPAELPLELLHHALDAPQCRSIRDDSRRQRLAAQGLDARANVRIRRNGIGAQRVALREHAREFAAEAGVAERPCAQHQVREPRVRAECGHLAPERRDATVGVERLETRQQVACLGERREWRRVEPGERARVAGAPAGELERERREVGLENLRGRVRQQRRVRRLAPQPVADARRGTAGTAAALVGRRARDAQGLEPPHAGGGIEALAALEAGIDHDAHAVDGEAGLGDVGRDDHLAAAVRVGSQRRVLRLGCQVAVQRQQRVTPGRQLRLEHRDHATDLAGAREEREQVARVRLERLPDAAGHQAWQRHRRRTGRRRRVQGLDRMGASRRAHEPRIVEHPAQGVAVERRRHHQQAQFGPQVALAVERQREAEVALQVTLVELVEHHARDALERGVALQHARENALGHHLDAGGGADAGLEPGAESDASARRLTERPRHALGDRARGQAARFEHHDPAVAAPRRVEQRERHHRALAGAGRRLEHDLAALGQRAGQFGQRVGDRQ